MADKIVLEEVIASKNPQLLKKLPKFILNYLKNIIHVDELNEFLAQNGHLKDFDFINASLSHLNNKCQIINDQYLPKAGRYILVSNHPLGGPDGLMLLNTIGKYRKDARFLVNDILMNIESVKELFLPINKHGSNPKDAIVQINKYYASDYLILNFPFGLVSRRKNGSIEDLVWHKSFVSKARQFNRDIIPVHFSGRNSNFFYNLSNLRKFLGIKANIEMLYLVHEMYKNKGKTFNITLGKPISIDLLSKDVSDKEWAERLRKYIYRLKDNPSLEFDTK